MTEKVMMLIIGTDNEQTIWCAESMIEKWYRMDPHQRVAYYHLQRAQDGSLLLANRNLHWVSNLSPEAAKAASKALGHFLGRDEATALSGGMKAATQTCHVIVVAPTEFDCPLEYFVKLTVE